MSGSLKASSVSSPGFLGLNTQDSGVTLESGFATTALNCVIDRFGRLGSRRGYTLLTQDPSSISTGDFIDSIFEFKKTDGTIEYLSSSAGKLYKGLVNITEIPIRDSSDTVTISTTTNLPYFQWASLVKGAGTSAVAEAYVVQRNQPALVYHPKNGVDYIFQRVADKGTIPVGMAIDDFDPNCVLSAFGRVWYASTSQNRMTIWYSKLLDGSSLSGSGSGLLDISSVVGNNDEIVALASHNGFLVVFCLNNIVIYQNPDDPTTMSVGDVVNGVGCISRDSVQNTGNDLVFLSASGVRSFERTIQEKSMPLRELSYNVRDDLVENISNEFVENIKSVFFERDSFYLLSFPSSKLIYCFDTRQQLETGAARVTTWNGVDYRAFCSSSTRRLFFGVDGGIAEYFGYLDGDNSFRMSYYTTNTDITAPNTIKLLKAIRVVVLGNAAQQFVIKYGFDYKQTLSVRTYGKTESSVVSEYNVAEYGIDEYSGGISTNVVKVNVGGSGDVVRFGIETDVVGAPVSIQKIQIYLKLGKLV